MNLKQIVKLHSSLGLDFEFKKDGLVYSTDDGGRIVVSVSEDFKEESVEILDGIENIPTQLFCDCQSLETAILPDSVQTIGVGVFRGCINLKKIKLSENLTEIPGVSFYSCQNLKNIINFVLICRKVPCIIGNYAELDRCIIKIMQCNSLMY